MSDAEEQTMIYNYINNYKTAMISPPSIWTYLFGTTDEIALDECIFDEDRSNEEFLYFGN